VANRPKRTKKRILPRISKDQISGRNKTKRRRNRDVVASGGIAGTNVCETLELRRL
jgi:hypothetical protein